MRLLPFSKNEKFIRATYLETGTFMTIDPGSKGGGVIYVERKPVESFTVLGATGYYQMAPIVRRYKVGLFIIETAFVGKSPSAGLKLGFWRGYAVASIRHAGPWPMSFVEVTPSTWQAKLPRDNIPEGQPWDKVSKTFATWQLAERILGERPKHDAVASAIGIGHWWNSLAGQT